MTATVLPFVRRQPIDVLEWLSDMRGDGGIVGDFAAEAIDRIEAAGPNEAALADWNARFGGEIWEAEKAIKEHGKICDLLERYEIARAFAQDNVVETLDELLIYLERLEDDLNEIRDVFKKAGVIRQTDETSNIAELLRMFLPVE